MLAEEQELKWFDLLFCGVCSVAAKVAAKPL